MPLIIVAIMAAVVLVGLASLAFGVDSRPGFSESATIEPASGLF